jgi:hypothetical protein
MLNETRKKIIVNEITYWKKNRMLPEQYCNYLLALYTEGHLDDESEKEVRRKKFWNSQFLFFLLVPLNLFLIHFTELSITLQIPFSLFLALFGILFAFYYSKKGKSFQIPLLVSGLNILVSSAFFMAEIFPNNDEMLYIIIFLNCAVWLFTGWKFRLPSFLISGILAVVFVLAAIFI